jgi:HEAT repeats
MSRTLVLFLVVLSASWPGLQGAGQVDTRLECVDFETPPRLATGASFKAPIGSGLEFMLSAEAPGGWAISVGPIGSLDDYLWIVSPPFRTAPHRYIGTEESSPGFSPRRFQFVTSKTEYERAAALVDIATRNPGKGIGIKDIEQAGRGSLLLSITDSGRNAADGSLEWIAVRGRACIAQGPRPTQSPEELVRALGQFPAALPGVAPSTGVHPPLEQRRREVYDQLWSLGAAALPALCRGLSDPDVQVRRNVALFLGVAGGNWYDRERQPRLVIGECVPNLVRAIEDSDSRVRELAAQAIAVTGEAGVSAVPALIRLLESDSEGDRNSACIGLAGIGPAAREALPALRKALSDPSKDVRGFAKRAIDRIER